MNGRMRWIGLGIVVGVLALAWRAPVPEPRREPHNCRFWALIGSDYPDSLIRDHLRDGGDSGTLDNLMELARDNYDGWGLGYFPSPPWEEAFRAPILRRGGPAADNPYEPEYGLAVDEMNEVRPRAVVAHVRRGTSGHVGIPNPHPFQHRGMLFAHNGTTVVSAMESYLDKYLSGHPPDYTQGVSATGHIDSELYFLCLLKYIDEHPEQDFATALAGAVQNFVATIGGGSLNFVLTDGDTLYALHFDYGTNPLAYYPRPVIGEGGGASPFWAVASQPMGSETSEWATIPNYTLGVFVSGAVPQFRAIGDANLFSAPPQSGGDGAAGDSGGGAGPGIETGRETREETTGETTEETTEETGETPPGHNCRFWALVGGGYPEGMIDRHLYSGTQQNLRRLAQANEDGWGLGYFLADPQGLPLRMPVIRRGGPPANSAYEPEYREAVEELEGIRPRAALAHVRRGTSGHFGIPDPHPFLHEGLLFAHNGVVRTTTVEGRLGPSYLEQHPTDFVRGYQNTNRIDSEVYFLYLLKLMEEHRELDFAAALLEAVRVVVADEALFVDGEPALNFVLTRGDTLYALQYYGPGYNFEHYYPADPAGAKEASPFWVVASESLGSGDGGWAQVPDATLAVFVPGELPRFLPVAEPSEPVFSFGSILVEGQVDQDEDGWFARLSVCCDPDVDQDVAQVSITLWTRADEGAWTDLGSTRFRTIYGQETDRICLDVGSGQAAWPDSLTATAWDVKIELRAYDEIDPVLVALPEDYPESGMDDFPIEGAAMDAAAPGPMFGALLPNPTSGEFRIPIRLDSGAAEIPIEILDVNGRLAWRGTGSVQDTTMLWSPTLAGVRLAAGVYLCRFRVDGRTEMRRLVMVR